MLPYRVSNPGPLTYESGALPIALRGPASILGDLLLERSDFQAAKLFYSLKLYHAVTDYLSRVKAHGKHPLF